jgi:hypothetical protein
MVNPSYTVEKEMPSGNRVILRPFGWSLLLRKGRIPNVLLPIVNDILDGKQVSIPTTTLDEKKAFYELLDDLCYVAYVHPRVVDDPQAEDEVSVDDIEDDDKLFLWTMIGAGISQMRSFRPEQVIDLVASLARELHGEGAIGTDAQSGEPA